MRNLRIIVIIVFLIVSVAFATFLCYDLLMVDHTAPVIVCDGVPLEVSIHATDKELCAGLTATDDVDGDITDRIVVRKVSQLVNADSALLSYAVFDSSSNFCTFQRAVRYTDYSKPHFSLSKPLVYSVSSTVVLADRLTATDALDGDISQRIRLATNTVNNTEPGEYPITFQVTNSSGDTSVVTLVVQICNTSTEYPVLQLSDYLIYVSQGSSLELEELRSYLTGARVSYLGAALDVDEVSIMGEVDTSRCGSYQVRFSYTNADRLTSSVYLTVVVE